MTLTHPLFTPFPHEDQRAHHAAIAVAIQRVLNSGQYILANEVAAFEIEFATHLNTPHVVGVASGTDAIELILRALSIGPGSSVVIPSFAPSAVAAAIARSGASWLYADIDPTSLTLCPISLDAVCRAHPSHNIKAALVVHLNGQPADWSGLSRVAKTHTIRLIEDCSQAHGALWQDRSVGTLGHAAAFSFYPTKNLGALGDAGAVSTADPILADRIRWLRQYGWRARYRSEVIGINSRLDELQAAILRAKLPSLSTSILKRRRLAAHYDARLSPIDSLRPIKNTSYTCHAYHQYPVLASSNASRLVHHLQKHGIPASTAPLPLHRQPAFQSSCPLPETEKAATAVFYLPLHPHLPEAAADFACDAIETFLHAPC
jgi:dTDP-4-amino-4,6-dideoxygalactose transaminase